MTTTQEQFWQSQFGNEYIDRNTFSPKELDRLYRTRYGVTSHNMLETFLIDRPIETVLEVGCNTGNQLAALGAWNPTLKLTGLEINHQAAEAAKKRLPAVEIVEGSALHMPFPDKTFDLVFTAGVLIHIAPADLNKVMSEIHRSSRHYILGLEYYASTLTPVAYRGYHDRLWKNDFVSEYRKLFPDLTLVREQHYPYQDSSGNVDSMFLLEKRHV